MGLFPHNHREEAGLPAGAKLVSTENPVWDLGHEEPGRARVKGLQGCSGEGLQARVSKCTVLPPWDRWPLVQSGPSCCSQLSSLWADHRQATVSFLASVSLSVNWG